MAVRMSPLMQVMKQTIAFLINKRLWLYFLPVQGVLVAALVVIEHFFPFFQPADQADLVFQLNPWVVSIFALVYGLLIITTMVKVMRLIFFDDSVQGVFIPFFKKDDRHFVVSLFKIALSSLVISSVVAAVFLYVLQYFLNLPPFPLSVAFVFGAMVVPYFMIRQCLRLPAAVAGDDLGFVKGWRMTRESGLMLCFYYMMSALFPLLFVLLIVSVLPFGSLFADFMAVLSGIFSVMIQAAFMAYLYVRLKDEA